MHELKINIESDLMIEQDWRHVINPALGLLFKVKQT